MDVSRICSLLGVSKDSVQELTGGYHNDACLLNDTYVLRSGSDFLAHEYAFLSKSGFGPKAYLYDEHANTLVTEFIKAEHPKKYTSELVKQVARFFSKLHTTSPQGVVLDTSWVDTYMQEHSLPRKAREVYAVYKSLPETKPTTVTHGDLALTNILLTDPITVIDWEFWTDATPERELALFSFKVAKNPQLMDVVFEHYKHPIDEELYRREWTKVAMEFIVLSHKWVTNPRVLQKRTRDELIRRRDWLVDEAYKQIVTHTQ